MSVPDLDPGLELESMLVKALGLLRDCKSVTGGACPICGGVMVRREEVSTTVKGGVIARRHAYQEVCPRCGYVLKITTVGANGNTAVTITVSLRLKEGNE